MTPRAVLATVLVTAALLTGQVAAGASPSASTPARRQAALLSLLDRTAWVGDGFDFQLTLRAVAAPAGSELRLSVHDEVRSRSEFAESLEGRRLRRELFPLPPVDVDEADGDGDGAITLVVPLVAREGVEPVEIDDPGTYPVQVELVDADGEVLDRLHTHLVRLPPSGAEDETIPLDVAVIISLHAPPTDLDAREVGPTEAPVLEQLGAVAAAIAAHPTVPVNLAVTPESLAEAAAVDPEAVADLAAGLADSGSEVLTSSWVQLDDAGWRRADPGALTSQVARGEQALGDALGRAPAATRLVRPGRAAPTAAALASEGATLLVVDEADLEPLDTTEFPYTVARPFDLALVDPPEGGAEDLADDTPTARALGADTALTAEAGGAADDPVLAASHVLADLAVIGADEPESARVATLVLPAAAAESALFLDALLAGLEPPPAPFAPFPAADPVVVATTTSDAAAVVDPIREGNGSGGADADLVVRAFAGTENPADVTAVADRLAGEEADLASYRSIFGAQDPIAARVEVVLANAASGDLDAGERGGAIASSRAARAELLGGITGPEQQTVRLTDREGQIQVVLTNASGAPASIDLLLRAERLRFPDAPDGAMRVQLDEIATRIDLRVEARSSGDIPLEIRLVSPDRRLVIDETRITVRATAISGVGIGLMAAAALFLAVWWTRTILRERRARRATRPPAHLRRS